MPKKIKAVICSLNSKYIHSSLAPWCLLAGVRKYGSEEVETVVSEGTINEKTEDVLERIKAEKADVIAFCCYIWNINTVSCISKLIKRENKSLKIIWGGPEVSYNAEEILTNFSFVDYVVSGEGEYPFATLLNSLAQGSECIADGVCYRDEKGIVVSPPYISREDPPSPYCDEYFENLRGRIAYIETSRGCPYSCAFCLSGRCGGVRFFDTEQAKENILKLAKSGTQTVKFVDRTFNANRKRAKEIFRFIIDNADSEIPKGVCFHFEIAGDILDSETIALLQTAPKGLIQLEIGMQSFNEKTLAYINRKTDTAKLKENIKSLIKPRNMHIHIDLIAGLPYEDLASFKESFDTAYRLDSDMLQFGFLKLLHGADMRENSEKYPCEFSNEPPYCVHSTPWLSKENILLMQNAEDCLDRIYNSGRFRDTAQYVMDSTAISPFDFYVRTGLFLSDKVSGNISLDDYTALLFEFFSQFEGVDKEILRDVMVCERLKTNASGKLPKCLRVEDRRLKKVLLFLDKNECTRREKNVKRGAAILYTTDEFVYADYKETDAVTNRYELKRICMADFGAKLG